MRVLINLDLIQLFLNSFPKDQAEKTHAMTDDDIIHEDWALIFSVTVCGVVLPSCTARW